MAGDQFQERTNRLEALARVRFTKLSASELKLMRAAQEGNKVAYCGPSDSDDDPGNDPSGAERWGPERHIRAEVIRWLCVDKRAKDCVDPQGIRIYAAKVVQDLDISYVTVPFPLSLQRCALSGNVKMRSAVIPMLDLSGSWLVSLDADEARVTGDVRLRDRFRAKGQIWLIGAQIGGNLDCRGGKFGDLSAEASSENDAAITADGISVAGQVLLSRYPSGNEGSSGFSFHADGEVRFLNAQVGMNFDCSGGVFISPPSKDRPTGGKALSADGVSVRGTVFLSKGIRSVGFYAEGEVRLLDAQIGGSLVCEGGTFLNPMRRNANGSSLNGSGDALTVERANIKGDAILCNSSNADLPVPFRGNILTGSFRADGAVSLAGAHIEGNLDLRRGRFKATSLVLERALVSSFMYSKGNWPVQGNLFLDGFVYGRIADGPTDAETVLKWLALQPEEPFHSQPFLQLAKVLKESGDDDGERRTLIAMEDQRWKVDHSTVYAFRLPLKLTAGYGYRPLWAIWEILGLGALGWIIYRRSYLAGNIVPTEKEAYQSFKREGRPPAYHGRFSPLVYSIENSLPLVKLGQADKWQPDPNPRGSLELQEKLPTSVSSHLRWPPFPRWLDRIFVTVGLRAGAASRQPPSRIGRFGTSAKFSRWFLWFQILIGWLLATLFFAGVTGLIHK